MTDETTPLLTANLLHVGGKGLDDIRTIVDAVKYQPPTGCGSTVLFVEDPATLSKGAAHALAAVMDDPPGHVLVVRLLTRIDMMERF